MKIVSILLATLCWAGVGVASVPIKAKNLPRSFRGYIHPIGAVLVSEDIGKPNYSYRWRGVYRADRNHPQVLTTRAIGNTQYTNYGWGDAAVAVYTQQVKAKGIPLSLQMDGAFSYQIHDRQGRKWQVTVRGDRDFHPPESGEYSVFIGTPGG